MIESCELVQVARIVDSRTTVRHIIPNCLGHQAQVWCETPDRESALGYTALVQRLGMLILFATSMYSIHTVY